MIQEMGLSWIVVEDIEKSIKFYTETVGLKLREYDKDYGWAELSGHRGGCLLGLAQANPNEGMKAGENAVITLTVKDIASAKEELGRKGVTFIGGILEIPGMVKLQLFQDQDGNKMQLVQLLESHCCGGGCH